jgi:hypothetical protein
VTKFRPDEEARVHLDAAIQLADKVTTQLREVIREGRELLQDFKAMQKEYADISEQWQKDASDEVQDFVRDSLQELGKEVERSIDIASKAVFRRFDKISSILLGEEKKDDGKSLTELAREWRATQEHK